MAALSKTRSPDAARFGWFSAAARGRVSTDTAAPKSGVGRDLVVGFFLALCAGGLYAFTWQDLYYGDGAQLIEQFSMGLEDGVLSPWMHYLYLPLADGVHRALPGYQPILALRLLSILSAAFTLGGSFVFARAFGAPVWATACAVGLLAVAPSHWFFGTVIELHALHGAVVVLAACVTVLAPWRRQWIAGLLSAAAFGFVYLSHKSGVLLFPGWILLLVAATRRQGVSLSTRSVVGWGVIHGVSLLLAMWVTGGAANGESDGLGLSSTLSFMGRLYQGFDLSLLLHGVLLPFALFWPLSLVGFARGRVWGWLGWSLVAMFLPVAAFVVAVFAYPNVGGYMAGVGPLFVLPVAWGIVRLCERRRFLAVALVVAQAVAGGLGVLGDRESELLERHRSRVASAINLNRGSIIIFAFDGDNQSLSGLRPDTHSINLWWPYVELRDAGSTDAQIAAGLIELISGVMQASRRTLYLRLDYRRGKDGNEEDWKRIDGLVEQMRLFGPDHPILEFDGLRYLVMR